MSIAGRASTDPDAPLPVDRMLRALAFGGTRGQRGWGGQSVRLGSCDDAALATGPGGRAAAFDGRIDNRAELAAELGEILAGGDAALLLAAHARWGDTVGEHVIGDYACAVWDADKRRLLLLVEPGGLRPLFWWQSGREFRFASEPRGLFAEPDVPRTLDEQRLAEWLCLLPTSGARTFHTGIARVQPGGWAAWQDGRVTTGRWWRPERLPELRLARHADYAEAVRASLEQAVAARIAGDDRIGSHLSAGLDSGAVTAIAARQLAAESRRLTAFTAAPAHAYTDAPGRMGDEWPAAAQVAAGHANIDHVRISNDDMAVLDVIERRKGSQDAPVLNPANAVWNNAIEREAQARGIGVMLTGAMGNMSFSYDGGELLAGQLRRGRIRHAAATLLAIRRVQRRRWLGLAGLVADAVLPMATRRRLRALVGKPEPGLGDYSAIRADAVERHGLTATMRDFAGDLRNLHAGDGRAIRVAVLDRSEFRGEFAVASRRLYGVDTRDPTLDRRLFELCLTIPEDQFLHHGQPRAIARSALAALLPAEVLNAPRRGLQAADWATPFDAAVPAMRAELARLRASRTVPGLVDLDRLDAALDRWPGANAADSATMYEYQLALSRAVATGHFIRTFEGGNG